MSKLYRDGSLWTDYKYISGVTGKAFELYAKYGESQLKFDCCSNNVIYLMTCRICLKQYVGQTR